MTLKFLGASFIFALLMFPGHSHGKRGHGGSYGGGSDGSGDGGDGGGDGGGDDYDDDGQCEDAQAEQIADLYLMPASYYSGSLHITHHITYNSAWQFGCNNGDNTTKQYAYDAVLAVGPVRDGDDTSEAFWSLQAYPPTQAQPQDAKNEFVRIRSSSYGSYERGNKSSQLFSPYQSNDTLNLIPWKEPFKQYWNTTLSPTTPTSNLSAPVDSWDLAATYTHQPSPISDDGGPSRPNAMDPSQPLYPHNLITLSDVCYTNYRPCGLTGTYPGSSPYVSNPSNQPFPPEVMAPVTFFSLGASISMTGIGTPHISLRLTSGRISRQIVHVHDSYDENPATFYCAYDETGSRPWLDLCVMYYTDYTEESPERDQEISATVEMRFEGARNESVSTAFVDMERSTKGEGLRWSSGAGGKGKGKGFDRGSLMGCFVLAVVFGCGGV